MGAGLLVGIGGPQERLAPPGIRQRSRGAGHLGEVTSAEVVQHGLFVTSGTMAGQPINQGEAGGDQAKQNQQPAGETVVVDAGIHRQQRHAHADATGR